MVNSFFEMLKQSKTLTLLVDVGSSSVGVALVNIEKGLQPRILISVRENIRFQETLSPGRFLLEMNHALSRALKTFRLSEKKNRLNVFHETSNLSLSVFCTLSSPWFILKMRNVHIEQKQEFEVTNETIEQYINEDIARLVEELKGTLPMQDVRIIEKKIIHIKLNGYEVKNPYKQKASRLDMSVIVGVSSDKVVKSIKKKMGSFFNLKNFHFGVFPVVAWNAVRDIFQNEKNFFFVDIGGEATDVSRIENDLLVGTVTFPFGKNFIIREISTSSRTVYEEAGTLFSMFLGSKLNSIEHAKISETASRGGAEWTVRFEKAITILAKNRSVPQKIFFTADTDIALFFLNCMVEAKSVFLIDAVFDVQYIDQFMISKFVSFDTGVARDPFVGIEALFAKKMIEIE